MNLIRPGHHPRVLIVDDEPAICRALDMALRKAGFDCAIAHSGESAMTLVGQEHFDVMLIDLRIPDQRGDVIFAYASALQPQLRTGTVFMTGDITEKGQQLLDACKCPVIQKPFDLREVIDAVRRVAPGVKNASA